MKDWRVKFATPPCHIRRDAIILRAIISGVTFTAAAAIVGLSVSRARIVVQQLATKLLREERKENPDVALRYTFTQDEFTLQPGLWRQRLEKYQPAIERHRDHG